jgi:hypothetical protein
MKSLPTIAAAALVAATFTACGSNSSRPVADPSSRSTLRATHTTTTTSPTTSPLPRITTSVQGRPSTLDPCQLVTQQEASTLAHAAFGPGQPGGNQVRHECVYGAQTPNVLTVYVIQGASTDDAQTEWNQLLAEAKQAAGQAANLVQLTPDTGLANRAEWVELDLGAIHVQGRGLAFLQGDIGVYVIDLVRGGTAPSQPAMTAQAQTVLSRLP